MTLSRVEVQESSFKSEPAQPEEKVTPDTSSTSPTTEEQAHLSRKTKSFFLAGRLRPFYIWFFFLFFLYPFLTSLPQLQRRRSKSQQPQKQPKS